MHTAGVDPVSVRDPAVLLTVNAQGTARVLDAFAPTDPTVPTVGVCVASVGGHRSFARAFDTLLRDPAALDFPRNVIEAAGVAADRPLAAYGLSKRSVIALVESRAKAWGAVGGRLVLVSPGLVLDTAMGRSAALLGSVSGYGDISAIGRPERASELADLIAFLVSDLASCLTGCDIVADGGMVAGTNWHLPAERRESWHACAVEG